MFVHYSKSLVERKLHKTVIIFVLACLFFSCFQKTPVEFYGSGQLKSVGDSSIGKLALWEESGELREERYYEYGKETLSTYYLERQIVRRSHYGYGMHLYDDNYSIGWELVAPEEVLDFRADSKRPVGSVQRHQHALAHRTGLHDFNPPGPTIGHTGVLANAASHPVRRFRASRRLHAASCRSAMS